MKKIFVLIMVSYVILSFSHAYPQPKGNFVIFPEVSLWIKTANMIPNPRLENEAADSLLLQMDSQLQEIIDNSPLIKLSQVYGDFLQGESLEINKYL